MKTPNILILLTVFFTHVVGFDYRKFEKAFQDQEDKVAIVHAEPLYGGSYIDDSSSTASNSNSIDYLTERSESALIGWEEPVRLNMFQFITNSGCYFYEHGPWFPYLDDYITTELRLQLSNWCAKYTQIVGDNYKK